MDNELDDGARSLSDAALVHAAKRRIDRAVEELKARPLDENALGEMREVLGEPVRSAQAALRRLSAGTPSAGAAPAFLASAPETLTIDAGGALPTPGEAPPPGLDSARRCTSWATGDVA